MQLFSCCLAWTLQHCDTFDCRHLPVKPRQPVLQHKANAQTTWYLLINLACAQPCYTLSQALVREHYAIFTLVHVCL